MKKAFILTILALLVLSVSLVSADTMIAGKIYNADWSDTVDGANVTVTCNGHSQSKTSENDGAYAVTFDTGDCNVSNTVSVHAICIEGQCIQSDSENPITGENTAEGTIHDGGELGIDIPLGVVNVSIIPEFGIIVGVLTVLSAVGIFFVIRRK